jgi:hypothetical protein
MPVPSMPSLPKQDGIDARLYAGICEGTSTVSAINTLTHVVGTSLPLPPTGEHEANGGPNGTLLLPPCAICKHWGGMSMSKAAQLLARVDGTLAYVLWGINAIAFPSPLCAIREHGGGIYSIGWLSAATNRGDLIRLPRVKDGALAHYLRGGKVITKLGPSILSNSVISLPPTNNNGGELMVDCALAHYARGNNAIIELSATFYAGSYDNDNVINSLSTINNRRGGLLQRNTVWPPHSSAGNSASG